MNKKKLRELQKQIPGVFDETRWGVVKLYSIIYKLIDILLERKK